MPTNADGTMSLSQNTDLYYLCGIDQEESVLVLFPDAKNPADREILFIRETNEHIAIWEGEKHSKEKATALSGINNIQWTSQIDATLHRLILQTRNIYLNTNEYVRADNSVQTRDSRFIKNCIAKYPLHNYERLAPLMHRLLIR